MISIRKILSQPAGDKGLKEAEAFSFPEACMSVSNSSNETCCSCGVLLELAYEVGIGSVKLGD